MRYIFGVGMSADASNREEIEIFILERFIDFRDVQLKNNGRKGLFSTRVPFSIKRFFSKASTFI